LSNFIRSILNSCAKFTQIPQNCLLCTASSGADALCLACRTALPIRHLPVCPICAGDSPTGAICGACLRHPPAFEQTLAGFDYTFPIDALLHAFKYGGALHIAAALTQPLTHCARQTTLPDIIVPMPLHPARLRERGFNQAVEIGKIIARQLNIPLRANACTRTRDTVPQASLPRRARRKNLRGAFACATPLKGMRVALVDDVMTTGATLHELAAVVRHAGATTVSAWVIARTPASGHSA